jgi:hypothetical protein
MATVVMDALLLAHYMGNRVCVRIRTLARGHGLGDGLQKTGCRWGMADCRLMNFEPKTPTSDAALSTLFCRFQCAPMVAAREQAFYGSN